MQETKILKHYEQNFNCRYCKWHSSRTILYR